MIEKVVCEAAYLLVISLILWIDGRRVVKEKWREYIEEKKNKEFWKKNLRGGVRESKNWKVI